MKHETTEKNIIVLPFIQGATRAIDVPTADWLIFHVCFFSVVEIPIKHSSLYNNLKISFPIKVYTLNFIYFQLYLFIYL